MTPTDRDFIAEAHREVVVNIGQVDAASKRKLDREVKAGRLVKWRGYWWPTAGAPWGIGPLKTCWCVVNPFEGMTTGSG